MRQILATVLVLLATGCGHMSDELLVIGHRGAMGHETENTLASVEKAMELGVDMIEIDVFKIDSGEIVVFHDERVERLTNGGGKIEEYNIFDLMQLTLDGNHKIPQLQDVLKLIDGKVALNIELKGANTAQRVNFITDYYIKERGWTLDQFVISSFNWDELRKMRSLNDDIAIAVLTEADPLEALPTAKELNAMAINPNFKMLNRENVTALQQAGYRVYTWTVNEPEDIDRMKELGVDGIFTNYPERLR
ncbi:glycerophosphodiester phosphodiesterase [Poritiphilus flavus]|uniref:Glycerophosphodiester phosphodiesterase n=1 Tax=Poritiphilus flavus TaxID=2697053 RepID=A0A6L9EDE4_9FLAO|nr:glycerophosphodiester phosphodiesterase family protein [Poritiphilus flavus]NAS12755.1 glycerophosphodiester phosphodiesterase [Poritiphilus flavus]